ncbi:MAG: MFS transporter [Alphaproteobacteria bacterium]|nr:MFS transporter [Alphaproteobacteria bacterium]
MSSEATRAATHANEEWRQHWLLVLVSMIGYSVPSISVYSLSAFTIPLHSAFGWSRVEITAGPTIYSFVSILCQPFVGRAVDRFGPRRIALLGVASSAVAFASFATLNGAVALWLVIWVVYSLALQLILTPVWCAAVASEFEQARGLALAVTLSGSAASGSLTPIAATYLIGAYGWRSAYVIMAAVVGFTVLLASWLFFHSRLDRLKSAGAGAAKHGDLSGLSLQEALRVPAFYKLICAIFAGTLIPIATLVSMIPMFTAEGLSSRSAALVASLYGASAVVGKLICGVLVKRYPGHLVGAAAVLVSALGYAMLLAPGQGPSFLALAVVLVGGSAGAQANMAVYLTTRYFGLRAFGLIFGVIGGALMATSGLGPLFGGFLFDISGSYRPMLMVGIPLAFLASLLMLSIGHYPEVVRQRTLAPQGAA